MRFRVHVNDEHVCDAGLIENGFVQVNLWHQSDKALVPNTGQDGAEPPFANFGVFAFVHKPDSNDVSQLIWACKSLNVGDRLTIELIPPGDISSTESVVDDIKSQTSESWYSLGEPIVVFDPIGRLLRMFKSTLSR